METTSQRGINQSEIGEIVIGRYGWMEGLPQTQVDCSQKKAFQEMKDSLLHSGWCHSSCSRLKGRRQGNQACAVTDTSPGLVARSMNPTFSDTGIFFEFETTGNSWPLFLHFTSFLLCPTREYVVIFFITILSRDAAPGRKNRSFDGGISVHISGFILSNSWSYM